MAAVWRSPGCANPLGACFKPSSINFAVFSGHARTVTLCLFLTPWDDGAPDFEFEMSSTGSVWHCALSGELIDASSRGEEPIRLAYAYRVDGGEPVLDPYATEVATGTQWGAPGPSNRGLFPDPRPFDWEGLGAGSVRLSSDRLVIYELHVRGFTQHPSSGVPPELAGTFLGVAERVEALTSLGVTVVELLPVTEFNETECTLTRPRRNGGGGGGERLTNYWGYAPTSFFAPMARYATSRGNACREFREMVKVLHSHGIEVVLDLVYNHMGDTSALQALSPSSYFLLSRSTPAQPSPPAAKRPAAAATVAAAAAEARGGVGGDGAAAAAAAVPALDAEAIAVAMAMGGEIAEAAAAAVSAAAAEAEAAAAAAAEAEGECKGGDSGGGSGSGGGTAAGDDEWQGPAYGDSDGDGDGDGGSGSGMGESGVGAVPTYTQLPGVCGRDWQHTNYSGCGNTVRCNSAASSQLILASLRWWVADMGVDGFRFDEATILARDRQGREMEHSPVLEAISNDPVLSHTRLIAEAWDAAGANHGGRFGGRYAARWAEWNGRYRDSLRRFIRGVPGAHRDFATCLGGCADTFRAHGSPLRSINFITVHDGFCLRDWVSYNRKHNRDNGEENRDGINDNESWNCGHEGPTDATAVRDLRVRQMKNALVALLLSRGTPMLLMGDEYGHTRHGNNNPWNQDGYINYYRWDHAAADEAPGRPGLRRFLRLLLALRANFEVIRRGAFVRSRDIVWHGTAPGQPQWQPSGTFLAFSFRDTQKRLAFFCAFNTGHKPRSVTLPEHDHGSIWLRVLDTAWASPNDFVGPNQTVPVDTTLSVEAYSCILLKSCD